MFDVIRGVSYKKHDASDTPRAGLVAILRANNIGRSLNFDDLVYVPRDNVNDEQLVQRNDILIAMSSGSKNLVGKAAPLSQDFEGAFGAFCGLIRSKGTVFDPFLALYLQSPQYTSWVVAAGRGIGINNLGKGDLESLPIPVPPLAEQKRIVAKVDELMALCDRLEAQQQQREHAHAALTHAALARFADAPTAENLEYLFHARFSISSSQLRDSILVLATSGKLVEQRAEEGNGHALLAELDDKGMRPRDRDSEDGDQCFEVPRSWALAPLGDVADIVRGVTFPGSEKAKEPAPGLVACLRTASVQAEIDWHDLIYISPSHVGRDDQWVAVNDILISMANSYALVGKVALVQHLPQKATFGGFLAAIRSAILDPGFLLCVLRNPAMQAAFRKSSSQTTNIANISLGRMRPMRVPIPPLAEQRRIVAKVNDLMALVDRLEADLAAARATGERLMSAVVAELTDPPARPEALPCR